MKRTTYNEKDKMYYDEEVEDKQKLYYSEKEDAIVSRQLHVHEWVPLSVVINNKLIQHCKCGAVRGMDIKDTEKNWEEIRRGGD